MADKTPSMEIRLTPVRLVILSIIGLLLLWISASWIKNLIPPPVDAKWSKPITMENVNFLCRWNDSAVAVGGDGVFRVLNESGNWDEKTKRGFELTKNEAFAPVIVDQHGPRAIFFHVAYSNKVQAIPSLVSVSMTPQREFVAGKRTALSGYGEDVIGKIPATAGFKRNVHFMCHNGVMDESELSISFVASSEDITERITSAGVRQKGIQSGPSLCGLITSSDRGLSWKTLGLPQFNTTDQSAAFKAGNTFCYLAADSAKNLWVSTKPANQPDWSQPQLLCSTLKDGVLGEAEAATLHLCWMDMRLKKGLGFFIYGDWDIGRRNNQVFYRNYRDGDARWGKEIKLSGSLTYCEQPSMSVEGSRIVVVWHNMGETVRKPLGRRPSPYSRAAIYYATSKDNGGSWSKPTKIQDSENSAGMYPCPKVILHKQVIHIFYNGFYQHREFPD